MAEIPLDEPVSFTAGDTVSWRKLLADYPATDGWVLSYAFRAPAGAGLDVTAAADGAGFLVTLTAWQTAAFAAGVLYWQARVTRSMEVHSVDTGQCVVQPSLSATATTAAFDGRTPLQKDLDAVRSAIRALLTGGAVQEYSIGNRSLRRYSLQELQTLESHLVQQVAREQGAARLSAGGPFFKSLNYRLERP